MILFSQCFELLLSFGWKLRFRRHLLCSLKAVLLRAEGWNLRAAARPHQQRPRTRQCAQTQRLLVQLIEGFTVAVRKCALRLAFVWLYSLRHSCADWDSGERGDLHHKVHAFHVKYPFKSGPLLSITEAQSWRIGGVEKSVTSAR